MSITQETRRENYEAVQPKSERRRQLILDILGGRALTAQEIADELHHKGYTPSDERNYAVLRLTELKKAGKVKTIGKRICGKTGRNVCDMEQNAGGQRR